MTTCKVHNVRFYKIEPKGINCMVYNKKEKKLAVSRSDTTLEIWDLQHAPHIERTIPSVPNFSIEALGWFEFRLFSVGLKGHLVEYDLKKLKQKYSIAIIGGAGWCLDVHMKSKALIIGTEQGYVNYFQITDTGVEYVKVFDKQDGRILCLKFSSTGKFAATGSTQSIRVWNVSTGHAVHKMTVGVLRDDVVWSLLITKELTVISADSRGCIAFWDGENGSLIESFQSHVSSVLTLCMSEDEKTVYCAGVDPTIMSFEKVEVKCGTYKWVKSIQRKLHEHDVRSLVLAGNKLYSGGVDGYLACSYYPPKTVVKYPPLLQNPSIYLAIDVQYLLLRYQTRLELWQLGREAFEDAFTGDLQLEEEPKKLLVIQSKHDEGTMCAAISNDGRWIAYSTASKFRFFSFRFDGSKPKLTSITSLPDACVPSLQAIFSPNNEYLITAPQRGNIVVFKISGEQLVLEEIVSTQMYIKDTITFLINSTCGKYYVAADPLGNVTCWLHDGNFRHHCTLPRYDSSPTALAIQPKTNNLFIVYSDQRIVEYNLRLRQFTDFSRQLDEKHPHQWLNRPFPFLNVTFDPRADNAVILHDDSSLCVIDKNKKLPKSKTKIPKLECTRDLSCARLTNHAFHIVKKSKHLVFFGWISFGEMVSVEIHPLNLLEQLPPAASRKAFGTK